MQKIGILNSDIAKVLADLGHTDTIVIGDCGLPVPAGVPKIDLALKPGTPSFLDVLTEVLKYMEVEKIHIASEMESKNPATWQKMQELFEGKEQILSDHEAFKAATKTAKAVERSGGKEWRSPPTPTLSCTQALFSKIDFTAKEFCD